MNTIKKTDRQILINYIEVQNLEAIERGLPGIEINAQIEKLFKNSLSFKGHILRVRWDELLCELNSLIPSWLRKL